MKRVFLLDGPCAGEVVETERQCSQAVVAILHAFDIHTECPQPRPETQYRIVQFGQIDWISSNRIIEFRSHLWLGVSGPPDHDDELFRSSFQTKRLADFVQTSVHVQRPDFITEFDRWFIYSLMINAPWHFISRIEFDGCPDPELAQRHLIDSCP